jgi:hypothetical protein
MPREIKPAPAGAAAQNSINVRIPAFFSAPKGLNGAPRPSARHFEGHAVQIHPSEPLIEKGCRSTLGKTETITSHRNNVALRVIKDLCPISGCESGKGEVFPEIYDGSVIWNVAGALPFTVT